MTHRRSIPASAPLTPEERVFQATARLVVLQHEPERPRTRADCIGGPRPCPWISCEAHAYANVTADGSLELNFPHIPPERLDLLPYGGCTLDAADEGVSAEEAADALNLTRGRVVQLVEMVRPAIERRIGR